MPAKTEAPVARLFFEWRKRFVVTQMEFAKRCGVSQVTITKFENGDLALSQATQQRFSDVIQGITSERPYCRWRF